MRMQKEINFQTEWNALWVHKPFFFIFAFRYIKCQSDHLDPSSFQVACTKCEFKSMIEPRVNLEWTTLEVKRIEMISLWEFIDRDENAEKKLRTRCAFHSQIFRPANVWQLDSVLSNGKVSIFFSFWIKPLDAMVNGSLLLRYTTLLFCNKSGSHSLWGAHVWYFIFVILLIALLACLISRTACLFSEANTQLSQLHSELLRFVESPAGQLYTVLVLWNVLE